MELKIEELSKNYGKKHAVERFNATLSEGVYGLLGPNGAGKTTLMRMIVDILRPTNGRILLNGADTRQMGDQYRALLGYLPQDFGVYRNFTAHRFLLYLSALKGLKRRDAESRIDRLLGITGLSEMKHKKIKTFSGGMKQRLGIAQALLNDPGILILDEPTAGLDPNERIRFRNLISEISGDKIVILSTHIVSDVEYAAREVLVMKQGRLVRQAATSVLENEMTGRVWKATIPETKLPKLRVNTIIGNILRLETGMLEVRLVSDSVPCAEAAPVEPTLEDYYLRLFGNETLPDGAGAAISNI